jgi:peptidylprolyl isomerase
VEWLYVGIAGEHVQAMTSKGIVAVSGEEIRKSDVERVNDVARAQDPNSADSQFFIVFEPSSFLDRQYTVWGEVVEGMQFVDQIKKGDQRMNGKVAYPDAIVKMQVAADAK